VNILLQETEYSKKIFRHSYIDPTKYGCRKLTQNYWFVIDGNDYVIKRGYWWNGASIPQFAWSIVGGPWQDEVYFGALIHDILYGAQVFPRRICDEVFYQVNDMSGMGWCKNQAMDKSLLVGGSLGYSADADAIQGHRKHLLVNGKAFKPLEV